MPVVRGGVHLAKGPGHHQGARYPLRSGPNPAAVEQVPLALPGGLLPTRVVHRVISQVPCRARTTSRLRIQIGAAIGDAARSVAEVADSQGVSWPNAHRAFIAHADAMLTEPQPCGSWDR